ncbi:hypothetical protein ERX46_16405 [Brumimicrobium glaciale]|uniref:Uncharacterized protein n=1 Tax=Brumimicrobium glaciale TaxID=200475 RepID=A0A4Q4KG21_9FLAO|nr:hypothetical protein [Brumimicrobium glaciale]RYM31487.1 hypothetical protein ERX46_16405 [Brumimicrobium glaciale]
MDFTPISINEYIALHLINNPSHKEEDLRNNLETSLADYNKNVKCSCGEDIWVIGSASLKNGCYTCLTGEKLPTDNYEIDSVVPYFTEADAFTVDDWGDFNLDFLGGGNYRDDDGTIIDPDSYPTPKMCLSCKNFIRKSQRVLCTLNKISQEPGEEFQCGSFDGV